MKELKELKKLKKLALNQKSIIDRISQGKLQMIMGGYDTLPDCLAGCGCQPVCQSACDTCIA